MTSRSPTYRLLAGLLVTILAVGEYSGYTIVQLRSLRILQSGTIDRNRRDSLLLLRIQNSLNSLALAMRDMLDTDAADVRQYPLTAWQPQFRRIRADLDDALAREEKVAAVDRDPSQRRYLADSFRQFWDSLDRVFALAAGGKADEARVQLRNSLQARQAALSADVARLLVANLASEQATALRTQELYTGVERNVYVFLAAMLIVVMITGLYLVQYVRRLFRQVRDISEQWLALAEQRRELAQQLIASQESTLSSISRELHDEFGQILTAVGAILQRANRRATREGIPPTEDLREVREMVQSTLERVRSLSQALHPSVLDEAGLESALAAYLPALEQRTGIAIAYEKTGSAHELDREVSIHLYRVVQEALNNVVRHSKSARAVVRLHFGVTNLTVEIGDEGIGYPKKVSHGLGLVSMRERTDLVDGTIEFLPGKHGGALVRATAPYQGPVDTERSVFETYATD
jgi:signal transduction histidine kinase